MFKKILTSIIILPFLIVPLFCCCTQQAQAATTGVEHCQNSQDEHGATHDHADHDSSHSCDCHSFSNAVENGSALQVSVTNLDNFFASLDAVKLNTAIVFKSSLRLAYLGPPGRSSAVPLYTLYHSLRV